MACIYKKDSTKLEQLGLKISISEDEYVKSKKVRFTCDRDHETELTRNSFMNKIRSKKTLCTQCSTWEQLEPKFIALGHVLLEINSGKVSWKCGNCDSERTVQMANIPSSKFCAKCFISSSRKELDEIRQKLDEIGMSKYELVEYKNNKHVELKCPNGHEFVAVMHDLVSRDYRCPDCSGERRKTTNLERYGCENVAAAPEVKEKIVATQLERFGGHHMKLAEIQEKRDTTMMEKYGLKYAFRSEEALKNARTICKEKYGEEYPLQSELIKDKIKENCRKKFGCDHPMQNPQEFERRQYIYHDFTFPSGRQIKVQGFEPVFIQELLDKGIDEKHIVTERRKIPKIEYTWSDDSGKEMESVYFPDLRVGNVLYEIKSQWTLNRCLVRNLAKFEACINQNYELEVVVYNNSRKRVQTRKYVPENPKSLEEYDSIETIEVDTSVSERHKKKKFDEYKQLVFERNGHELIAIEDKYASYKCGSCGNQGNLLLSSLTKSGRKTCMKCEQARPGKKTKESVQQELDELGIEFEIVEYKNANNITARCAIGHEFTSIFTRLKTRKCPKC